MKPITIVIPNRAGQDPMVTIKTLYEQTFQEFDIIIINDFTENACIARNEGLKKVTSEYVLFSDNDTGWEPDAIWNLYDTLRNHPECSYAYGCYEMGGTAHCQHPWDEQMLKKRNLCDTRTLVRTADHPGWDPNIRRLQDWDVWLTMLARGKKGIYCGEKIFTTWIREGITFNSIPYEEAVAALRKKHKI